MGVNQPTSPRRIAVPVRRGLVLALCFTLLPACQTSPTAAPAVGPADVWTTPPRPGEAVAGRLERRARAAWQPTDLAPVTRAAPVEPVDFASAGSGGFAFEGRVTALSKYVWRAQLVTDDPVLQPEATLTYDDFSLGVWANIDLTNRNGERGQLSELDVTGEYGHTLLAGDPMVRGFIGATAYLFPSTAAKTTAEVYGGISLDLPVHPRFTVYYDVVEIEGLYATIGLHEEIPLVLGSLLAQAEIGWGDADYNTGYWGVAHAGFNDLRVSAVWNVPLGGWTLTGSVAYSAILEDRLDDTVPYDDNWIFALGVARSF